jgi:hypothetical protein
MARGRQCDRNGHGTAAAVSMCRVDQTRPATRSGWLWATSWAQIAPAVPYQHAAVLPGLAQQCGQVIDSPSTVSGDAGSLAPTPALS